jgi:hypothetical protein
MTQDEIIEVKEGIAQKATEVLINEPKPSGWMAWYRTHPHSYFSQVYTDFDFTKRDFYKCPAPLFVSKEEAIAAARKTMGNQGGEIRLVKVEL